MDHIEQIRLFQPSEAPRLFYCEPGQNFAGSVVAGLKERLADCPPEALSRVRIYANAARMRSQIIDEFHEGGASFLPRVRLITEFPMDYPLLDLRTPVSPMQRMLELRQLVAQLVKTNRLVAHQAAVPDLANTLTSLIEEMSDEGVSQDAFDALDIVEHSGYWELSLKFLNIVTGFVGPSSQQQPGRAEWFRRAATAITETWKTSPDNDPVIIAGSTGSRGTTAMLMHAVAHLPQGAVILPGFDIHMPQGVLTAISKKHRSEDHPQYRYARLLDDLNLTKDDVKKWHGSVEPEQTARNALVSLSLRPAPVTNEWMNEGPKLTGLEDATRQMSLLLAPDPRREALAIALAMRNAVHDNRSVALITPDKDLTRMVVTALGRWNIDPDASMGQPLDSSVPGRLFRQVLRMSPEPPETEAFLSLMKHPLVCSGGGRGNHLNLTRKMELWLRRDAVPFVEPRHVLAFIEKLEDEDATDWAKWVTETVLLKPLPNEDSLPNFLSRHITYCELLCRGYLDGAEATELWSLDAGEALAAFVKELQSVAHHGGHMRLIEYAGLFENLMQGKEVRNPVQPHPKVMIWGTLEARVQTADLVILGGLNDGTWPELPAADPWLNRDLRRQSGMVAPERKVGLSAHDYQQAISAPEVILSRAKRGTDSEKVPSRWLNRLTNLLGGVSEQGANCLKEMEQRGSCWLERAEALERPLESVDAAVRPSIVTPVSVRPRRVSISDVRKILEDPYSLYAQKVLRLSPIEPLFPKPDARLRGIVVHRIAEVGMDGFDPANDWETELARFKALARAEFESGVAWPERAAHWCSQFESFASGLLEKEQQRRLEGSIAYTEVEGKLRFENLGIDLVCKADRIDRLDDGSYAIYDYKSSEPPNLKSMGELEKQLLLEAVIAENGGFSKLGPVNVSKVAYLGIGRDQSETTKVFSDGEVAGVKAEASAMFAAYLHDEFGFLSRRIPNDRIAGNYDHLARCGEWSDSDVAQKVDVR